MKPNYVFLEWEEIGIMIDELALMVKNSKIKFDGVYGVPRGGLSIAVKMSHVLGLPMLAHPTKNTLVVDDISDTGVTLQNIKNKKIACLYSADWTVTKPDFFIEPKTKRESWIIFPWEGEDELDKTVEGRL